MEVSPTSNGHAAKRSKRAACDRCRNQKLRCERPTHLSVSSNPPSCIRCTRLGSVCGTSPARRLGRPVVANLLPSLVKHTNSHKDTAKPTSISSQERSEQTGSSPPQQCVWKMAAKIPTELDANGTDQDKNNPMPRNSIDVSDLDISNSSLDEIMGTVLKMGTAPFPEIRQQATAPPSEIQPEHKVDDSVDSSWDNEVVELLALGNKFMDNIVAWRSSTDKDVDNQHRLIVRAVATSEELHAILKYMVKRGRIISSYENLDLSEIRAVFAQGSSCCMLEIKQWKVIIGHIMHRFEQSPDCSKHPKYSLR